jgi:hypothetical protein
MIRAKRILPAVFLALSPFLCSAGVIDLPSSPVPSLAVPSVLNSGLPASPLSLPFDSVSLPSPSSSLSPSLAPLPSPSPLPAALIPSRPLAVAAAIPSFPDLGEPIHAARSLNAFWDGLRVPSFDLEEPVSVAVPLGALEDEPAEAGRLAPWLETDDTKVAAALDRAVALARSTRAGRRALDEAERILAAEGRTLPVLVLDLGRNYGEYDYLARNMRLHAALFKKGREADLAGTLVHELTHVAQHGRGVPSNALEMEIEAHLQDLDMMAELGVKPPKGTFARQALDLLAQGPDKFISLIQAAVPGTVFLGDSSLEDVIDQLEDDLAAQRKRAKRSKTAAALIPVIERDLARLRSAEGADSYRAFSKRVLALLKRRAAEAR